MITRGLGSWSSLVRGLRERFQEVSSVAKRINLVSRIWR